MSRPFTYNDENFTVIGNMLFCHLVNPTLTAAEGDYVQHAVLHCPSGIIDRLADGYRSGVALAVITDTYTTITANYIFQDGKLSIAVNNSFTNQPITYTFFVLLKDI